MAARQVVGGKHLVTTGRDLPVVHSERLALRKTNGSFGQSRRPWATSERPRLGSQTHSKPSVNHREIGNAVVPTTATSVGVFFCLWRPCVAGCPGIHRYHCPDSSCVHSMRYLMRSCGLERVRQRVKGALALDHSV